MANEDGNGRSAEEPVEGEAETSAVGALEATRLVLCTCPERDVLRLAHTLVELRQAACVNIVPDLTSVYRWNGRVCEDKESLAIIKTTAAQVPELTQTILDIHSYAVPEVISLPIQSGEGNALYLEWLVKSIGPLPGADFE